MRALNNQTSIEQKMRLESPLGNGKIAINLTAPKETVQIRFLVAHPGSSVGVIVMDEFNNNHP